jgi:hypothetical protein
MNEMIKGFSISVLIIMAVSCAATTTTLPEKYNLDNDLEAIDQIFTFKVSSWEQVDHQSIILRANLNDYYLLILHRPIDRMISGLSIGVSSTVSTIRSGFDRIIVNDTPFTEYYFIDKIYKLKGKEQAKEIKERLRKEMN